MFTNRADFLSWLALGDSYTVGESVGVLDRYPLQTVNLLKNSGIYFSDPEYLATTGWTTEDLLAAILEKKFSLPVYDLVSVLIGVNDQYQGSSTAEYRVQFTAVLKQSVLLAGDRPSRVVVLSIPDYSVTPYAHNSDAGLISSQIDHFNKINKELAISHGVNYSDITGETRKVVKDSALLAADGLHYSAKEYAVWAQKLAPALQEIFRSGLSI